MGYLKIRMPAQKKTSPKGDYTALELRRVGFSAKDLKQGAGGGGWSGVKVGDFFGDLFLV